MNQQVWRDQLGNYFTGRYGTIQLTRDEAARLLGSPAKLAEADRMAPPVFLKWPVGRDGE